MILNALSYVYIYIEELNRINAIIYKIPIYIYNVSDGGVLLVSII